MYDSTWIEELKASRQAAHDALCKAIEEGNLDEARNQLSRVKMYERKIREARAILN